MGKIGRFIANVNKYKHDYGFSLSLGLTFDSYLKRDASYASRVTRYLEDRHADLWKNFSDQYKACPPKTSARKTIWVLWWNGEDTMPEIAKRCRRSLHQYHGDYEVVSLSKYNIKEYLDIPAYILEKVQDGRISLPHMADFVRVALLRTYGGIWLDSTVLLTDYVPNEYMDYKFLSRRIAPSSSFSMARGRWSGYYMVANEAHSFLFELLYAFYLQYWKEHDLIITYLLLDYLLDIAYRHYPEVKKMIDAVPLNNTKMKELQERLNDDYDEALWQTICQDTIFHKLTYKKEITNANSFYKVIIGEENRE